MWNNNPSAWGEQPIAYLLGQQHGSWITAHKHVLPSLKEELHTALAANSRLIGHVIETRQSLL